MQLNIYYGLYNYYFQLHQSHETHDGILYIGGKPEPHFEFILQQAEGKAWIGVTSQELSYVFYSFVLTKRFIHHRNISAEKELKITINEI